MSEIDPTERMAALERRIMIERSAPSLAIAVATEAYADGAMRDPLARWAHMAQLFCILCAFGIPVILFWAFTQ